jgi:hypothetical protein
MGDQPYREAATYAGKHKHRSNANRYPCLELDSSPRSQCLSGRSIFHALDRATTVIGTLIFIYSKLCSVSIFFFSLPLIFTHLPFKLYVVVHATSLNDPHVWQNFICHIHFVCPVQSPAELVSLPKSPVLTHIMSLLLTGYRQLSAS